jgi:hypothetical protein
MLALSHIHSTSDPLSDGTVFRSILFPDPAGSTIWHVPGGMLESILVSSPGGVPNRSPSLGLLLSQYTDSTNTGQPQSEHW